MAIFKCKNCEHVFEHFCDNYNDAEKAKCPGCRSHWVELILKKKPKPIFPTLPYSDPPFPIPNSPPFPNIDPWPPTKYWTYDITHQSVNKNTGSVSLW